MKISKLVNLLDVAGYLSLFLAVGAVSITSSMLYLLGTPLHLSVVILPLLTVYSSYNFDRLVDSSEGENIASSERNIFVNKNATLLRVTVVISLFFLIVLSIYHDWTNLFFTTWFVLACLFYVLPILPFKKFSRLKDIPTLKSFYVPACWCLFLFIGVQTSLILSLSNIIIFMIIFIFIRAFLSGSLGDIRDYRADEVSGVRTFAMVLGKTRTLKLLEIVHWMSIILIVLVVFFGWIPIIALGLIPSAFIGYFFFVAFKKQTDRKEIFFELYDLEFILYFPGILLADLILS